MYRQSELFVKSRIGEENTSNQNQKMKIIAYRNSSDIDIEFEDGTVVRHKGYRNFREGRVRNPNEPSAPLLICRRQ